MKLPVMNFKAKLIFNNCFYTQCVFNPFLTVNSLANPMNCANKFMSPVF